VVKYNQPQNAVAIHSYNVKINGGFKMDEEKYSYMIDKGLWIIDTTIEYGTRGHLLEFYHYGSATIDEIEARVAMLNTPTT
jgi:hypothetical protein